MNSTALREVNVHKILNLISGKPMISRADISRITNLAMPTIMRITEDLLQDGIIIEVGKGQTSKGRKPILLKINKYYNYFIGVSIGTKLISILTDFKGNILDKEVLMTDFSKGPQNIVINIRNVIEQLIQRNGIDRQKIRTVGIARPGIGFKTGNLIADSAFTGWDSINFDELVQTHLSEFMVQSNNINICGILGEQWFGELKDYKKCLYVFIDAGVSSAVIIDGKVFKGRDDCAGQFGHQIVNFDGEPCYCGSNGCLETYSSSVAIIKKIKERILAGEYTLFNQFGIPDFSFSDVIEMHKKGDALCSEVLRNAGKIMGIGVANLINIYNPEKIVFGGEVSQLAECYIEEVVHWAKQHTFIRKAADVEFSVSNIQKYSEALGAVAYALSTTFNIEHIFNEANLLGGTE